MIYQIKEKAIYNEADAIFFEKIELYGEIINTYFNDYSGISVGSVIYQSDNKEKIYTLKTQLEVSRIKTIDKGDGLFYFIQELAHEIFSSTGVTTLQKLYDKEFNINLINKNAELLIENEHIFIPPQASDEQIVEIQKILNLYFYDVKEISEEDKTISNNDIDWNNRLAILLSRKSEYNEKEKSETETVIDNLKVDSGKLKEDRVIDSKESKIRKKQWWRFW